MGILKAKDISDWIAIMNLLHWITDCTGIEKLFGEVLEHNWYRTIFNMTISSVYKDEQETGSDAGNIF